MLQVLLVERSYVLKSTPGSLQLDHRPVLEVDGGLGEELPLLSDLEEGDDFVDSTEDTTAASTEDEADLEVARTEPEIDEGSGDAEVATREVQTPVARLGSQDPETDTPG